MEKPQKVREAMFRGDYELLREFGRRGRKAAARSRRRAAEHEAEIREAHTAREQERRRAQRNRPDEHQARAIQANEYICPID